MVFSTQSAWAQFRNPDDTPKIRINYLESWLVKRMRNQQPMPSYELIIAEEA